jgi:hypothetical protein
LSTTPFLDFSHVLSENINTTSIFTDLNVGGNLILEAGSISLDGVYIQSWDDISGSIPPDLTLESLAFQTPEGNITPVEIKPFHQTEGQETISGINLSQGEKNFIKLASNDMMAAAVEIMAPLRVNPSLNIAGQSGSVFASFGTALGVNSVSFNANVLVNGSPVLTEVSATPTDLTLTHLAFQAPANFGGLITPIEFLPWALVSGGQTHGSGLTIQQGDVHWLSFEGANDQEQSSMYVDVRTGVVIHENLTVTGPIMMGGSTVAVVNDNPTFTTVTIKGFTISGINEATGTDVLEIKKDGVSIFHIAWDDQAQVANFFFNGNIHADNFG